MSWFKQSNKELKINCATREIVKVIREQGVTIRDCKKIFERAQNEIECSTPIKEISNQKEGLLENEKNTLSDIQ